MARIIKPDSILSWERADRRVKTPLERALEESVVLTAVEEIDLFSRRDRFRDSYLETIFIMEPTIVRVAQRMRKKASSKGGIKSAFQRDGTNTRKPSDISVEQMAGQLEEIAERLRATKTVIGKLGETRTRRTSPYRPHAARAVKLLDTWKLLFFWLEPLFEAIDQDLLQIIEEADPVKRDELALQNFNVSGREAVKLAREARTLRRGIAMIEETVLLANIRLVRSIALRYLGRGCELCDLEHAGNAALRNAVGRFDYRRGNKFATLAIWWIRQGIVRLIKEQARLIRIPSHQIEIITRVRIARNRLLLEGNHPYPECIAEKLGIPQDAVINALNADRLGSVVDLDAPVGEDGDSVIGDFIAAPSANGHEDRIGLRERVAELLVNNRLTARELHVIRMRFGFTDDGRSWTLEAIRGVYHVSRERVRQIEEEALQKLSPTAMHMGLREFLDE